MTFSSFYSQVLGADIVSTTDMTKGNLKFVPTHSDLITEYQMELINGERKTKDFIEPSSQD